MSTTRALRALLQGPGIVQCPIVFNPLSAQIAKDVGFQMVGVGGYALGANLMTPEPLLTLTECVHHAGRIVHTTGLPVVVDAGAGFGSPVHVQRTVEEFEHVGVAGIHLEDQVYPKRVHYHRGIEHIVPAEEMVEKIEAAVAARTDVDFVLVARTDAMATDGYDEAIRRANLYREAGADMILCWPNSVDEAARAPGEIDAPTIYGLSEGNRLDRPRPTIDELTAWGYALVRNPHLATLSMYQAVQQALRRWLETGQPVEDGEAMIRARKDIEDTMDLDRYYELESITVESRPPR